MQACSVFGGSLTSRVPFVCLFLDSYIFRCFEWYIICFAVNYRCSLVLKVILRMDLDLFPGVRMTYNGLKDIDRMMHDILLRCFLQRD